MLGLLIVDHGSRRAEANAQLEDIAARVRVRAPGAAVAIAHMELAPPDIATGFAALVAQGATEIHVLPYFLSDGRHSREDIPRIVGEAAAPHPRVTWRIAAPLGPHDLLAELLLVRAREG